MENVKMFLFARWISTLYSDIHDIEHKISVLNTEDGYWWKTQLEYFNDTVYPNYVETGVVEKTEKFLKDTL